MKFGDLNTDRSILDVKKLLLSLLFPYVDVIRKNFRSSNFIGLHRYQFSIR